MFQRRSQLAIRTGRLIGNATKGLFRWMTTDHYGTRRSMSLMRFMTFRESVKYFMLLILVAAIGGILNGFWITVLICFGIPYLITGHLF
jgi:hypothetical protein